MTRVLIWLATALLAVSCVSLKKYEALDRQRNACRQQSREQARTLAELEERVRELEALRVKLVRDSLNVHRRYEQLRGQYGRLLREGSAETANLLKQVRETQSELDARSRYVTELESLLRARDRTLGDLRSELAAALPDFEGRGLTVDRRQGRVYVSLEDRLLFRSGSFEIEPRGEQAVGALSGVLAKYSEVRIEVIGHTDSLPYRGTPPLEDNWDLSVKRATAVVRCLLRNKAVAPGRVSAAGHGEYDPVGPNRTAEDRRRNRRTEIVLSPGTDAWTKLIQAAVR